MQKRENREYKFGYKLVGTQVVIYDEEAQIVRDIFNYYINGLSASQILKKINSAPIKYYKDGSDWIRTNIIQILRDEVYKGTDEYPQVISIEIFDKVRVLREEKKHKQTPEENSYIAVYKDKMKCAICGNNIKRISNGGTQYATFKCSNSNCKCNHINIRQYKIENYLKMLFREIADGHVGIEWSSDKTIDAEINQEIKKKTNELRLHMQDTDIKTETILNEIRNIASMRFDAYVGTGNSVQTKFIIDTLQIEKNNERVSAETIDKIIKKIQIDSDKSLTVTMINGKKFIERMAIL